MFRSFHCLFFLAYVVLQANAAKLGGLLGCFTCCCQNPDEDCQQPVVPAAPSGPWKKCPSGPPKGQKWACADDSLDFPTVDCLVQDIQTCGLVNKDGAPTVFYSFGVATKEARPNVRDKLNPQGNMFNDGLMSDDSFSEQVIRNPKYAIGDLRRVQDSSSPSNYMNRQNIFVARMSEALARASKGDVYLVYGQEVGQGGKFQGLGGIYQLPIPIDPKNPNPDQHIPNAWRAYELPTLQQNKDIKAIYGVDKSKNYPLTQKEWTPDDNKLPKLPESNAMQLQLPPRTNSNSAKFRAKRDDLCSLSKSQSGSKSASHSTSHKAAPASTAHSHPASITAKPTATQKPSTTKKHSATGEPPKCMYFGPEPPVQPKAYCKCDGKSLPLMSLTTNVAVEKSCSYTAMPPNPSVTNPNPAPAKTTHTDSCQVCSLAAANEESCDKIPNCTPVPHCMYFGPEPPVQPKAYCSCNGKTLPLMSLTKNVAVESSCSYSAMPTGASITNPNPPPPKTTNTKICEVCSLVEANEKACTRLPNCTPLQGFATVEHGSSAVNVGILTGEALYTSVSSALEELCPKVTQTEELTHCSTNSVSVGDIDYIVEESHFDDGSFIIQVESSQYNTTNLRDGLIKAAALTAQHSASKGNSYEAEYETIFKSRRVRRWWDAPLDLGRRGLGLEPRDHPYPTFHDMKLWRAINFAGAHYYSPYINNQNIDKGTDYIDVNFSFEAGDDADLICDFAAALVDSLAIIAPEFAVGEIELGEAIDFACKAAVEEEEEGGSKRKTRRKTIDSREALQFLGANVTLPLSP